MTKRFALGSAARVYLDVIVAGQGETNQTPRIAIQRRADGRWYGATAQAFQTGYVENAMNELDATDLPGRYAFDFDHSTDELASTEFIVKMMNAGPSTSLHYDEIVFGPFAAAARPGLCSIQGTVFGLDGEPRPGELVQATLIPVLTDALGRGYTADARMRTYSAADGSFDLPVVRGATVRLEIRAIGYDRRALVPDAPSVLFTAL